MKTVGQRLLKLLGGQAFWSQGPCDLDLWPDDFKINRGHLLILTNLHAKCETVSQSYWADKKKTNGRQKDGQPDGLTDKLIPVYPSYNFVVRGYNNGKKMHLTLSPKTYF
jgi:hypothetical protein